MTKKLDLINLSHTRQYTEELSLLDIHEVYDNYHAGKYNFNRKRVTDNMLYTLPKLFIYGDTSIQIVGHQSSGGSDYIKHCRKNKISYDPINKIILLEDKKH